jgi:hypothetical protein
MNWGYKILIAYIVFVLGIVFLVFKSSSQKVDLVTTDYYDKELVYQQKIDAMNNVRNLSDTVQYGVRNSGLTIIFPKDFSGKTVAGNAVLYCPSDENRDITQNFSVKDLPVSVPIHITGKKEYELQLTWQSNGTSYYFEKKFLIN